MQDFIKIVISVLTGSLTMFVFFIVTDLIFNMVLFPCLAGTTCAIPAYASLIKIMFNLIGLILSIYLVMFLLAEGTKASTGRTYY